MIKTIVFDMGGVLIDYNPQKTLNTYFAPEYHDVLDKYVFSASVWQDMDHGLTVPEEVLPGILEKIPPETHARIREMILDFYPYMPPFPEMCEFVKQVKAAGYSAYLLSNATPRFFDRYMDIPAMLELDGFFISALYRLMKPQKEIYEAFFRKFSLKPEECYFVDDMQRNIEGARACGMDGHVFRAPDIAALRAALLEKGVEIPETNA